MRSYSTGMKIADALFAPVRLLGRASRLYNESFRPQLGTPLGVAWARTKAVASGRSPVMWGLKATADYELAPRVIDRGGTIDVSGIKNRRVREALQAQRVKTIEVERGAMKGLSPMWVALKVMAAGMEEGGARILRHTVYGETRYLLAMHRVGSTVRLIQTEK
ncbi:MAG: hypothetical protein PHH60_04175 [Candidatus Margulisbacteria bacterium]|nr:hypothetical protein [Candidatus Margulisiibacteriota bacterium]